VSAERLRQGYRTILRHIYAPGHYYERVRTFLREYRAPERKTRLQVQHVLAFLRSVLRLGILGKGRLDYWRLLVWTHFHRPELLPLAVTLAITGYHCRKVCTKHVLK